MRMCRAVPLAPDDALHARPTAETYPLSLHDALPICPASSICASVAPDGSCSVGTVKNTVPWLHTTHAISGGGFDSVVGLTDRKSTRLNSSHVESSYAASCSKKKIPNPRPDRRRARRD